MKVLIVARNKNGRYAPFITEQVSALESLGVECRYFGVSGRGVRGYLKQLPELRRMIRDYRPDIVHAHYGLCGVLANLQRRVPVVTTYHGSDINDARVFRFSRWAIRKSRFNIFVSQQNVNIARPEKDYALIPCGINLADYPLVDRSEARKALRMDPAKKYVLFSGAFDNSVKNAPLAKAAMTLVPEAELMELRGYSRPQVALLMQAADALLLTSFMEGSPQVVKEAMACGCPVVSVDVGDVRDRVHGLAGCFVMDRTAESLAKGLQEALAFGRRTEGRQRIISDGLTNDAVAVRIREVYHRMTDIK